MSPVVGNVLTLGVDPIDLESVCLHLNGVVAILVNDALRLLHVALLGLRFPQVHQIARSPSF